MRVWDVIYVSGIVHLTIALISVTSYHPDEYYQGVERAYYLVFGEGIVSWEWTAQYSIRSHFYILPYMWLFSALKVLGIHHNWVFRIGPRLVNACFAMLADIAFAKIIEFSCAGKYKTCTVKKKEEGVSGIIEMGIYLHLFNAFLLYTSHRSLANSFELFVYLYALFFWFLEHEVPDANAMHSNRIRKHHHDKLYETHNPELFREYKRRYSDNYNNATVPCITTALPLYKCVSVFIMSVAICARPTSLFLFLPLVCRYALSFIGSGQAMSVLLYQSVFFVVCCAVAVAGVIYIDTTLYCQANSSDNSDGECKMVVPMLNFVDFNVVKGYSSFFGEHVWHWNFTQGLPQVLGLYTLLVPVLVMIRIIKAREDVEHPNTMHTAIDYSTKSERREEESILSGLAVGLGCDALCYIGALSLFSRHQEARFLMPVLPVCHLILAEMIQHFSMSRDSEKQRKGEKKMDGNSVSISLWSGVSIVCIFIHALLALYLLRGHQSGAEVAFSHVNNLFVEYQRALHSLRSCNGPSSSDNGGKVCTMDNKVTMHVHLLAPCFSFPGYSFLHPPANMSVVLYQPDCDIKYTLKNRNSGNAVFRKHPLFFYKAITGMHSRPLNSTNARNKEVWPAADVILTFDSYVDSSNSPGHALGQYLSQLGYQPQLTVHHAHLRYDYDDEYVNKQVLIYTSKEISSLLT